MELKFVISEDENGKTLRFNRTFMELKSSKAAAMRSKVGVLIVPLWNWNDIKAIGEGGLHCFNRTFMELKYIKVYPSNMEVFVLIVPLWNWNGH